MTKEMAVNGVLSTVCEVKVIVGGNEDRRRAVRNNKHCEG